MRASKIGTLGLVLSRWGLAVALAAGCAIRTPPPGDADAGVADGPDAGADQPCPPPTTLTPAEVPSGYLPAERVTLTHPTDGDTATFRFAAGSHAVRFLYLDTEEAYGDATTAFGVQTSQVVREILQRASELVVAVREAPREAGAPNTDPYGRWLGLVFVEGELLETRLVREGWSAYYTEYGCAPEPIHTAMLLAEAEARANQRGIWAPGHPTDYRPLFSEWIGGAGCRPNPFFNQPYCAAPEKAQGR